MSSVRVLSHAAAVRGGVEHFVRRATLDMDELARELAVSRATLYRTVGSRDALLGHVLAAIGCWIVERTVDDRLPRGPDGVIEVSRRFAEALQRAEPLQRFAQREPDVAQRVLLNPAGRVHALTVTVQRDLFRQLGGLDPGTTPGAPRLPTQHDRTRHSDLPRPSEARAAALPTDAARTEPSPTGRAPTDPQPTKWAPTSPTRRAPTGPPPTGPAPPAGRPSAAVSTAAAPPPDPLTERAYLYVSVLEAVLYGPLLAGHRPEFGLAEPALRALLR